MILPKNWSIASLDDLFMFIGGGTPDKGNPTFWNGNLNWASVKDVKGKYLNETIDKITPKAIVETNVNIANADEVILVTRISPGEVSICRNSTAINQDLKIVKKFGGIKSQFIYYLFLNIKDTIIRKASGTTVKGIRINNFKEIFVNVPPLNEQNKIVEKLEEILSELDNGLTNLELAANKLKIYKQILLKYAFEGKLSKGWRAQNLPNQANGLLEEIKIQKEAIYNNSLENWKERTNAWTKNKINENKPEKPKMQKALLPITNEEIKKTNWLPDKWALTKLHDVCLTITDGDHQAPPKSSRGIPFITISNIRNNQINFSETFYVDDNYFDSLPEYKRAKEGDVLYTVTGSYGVPVLVDFDKPFCFQRHISLIRPVKSINSKWLYFLLQTPFIYNQATNESTGTAQKTVGLASIRNFIIPCCTLEEQLYIVQEVEKNFSLIEHLENTILQSSKQLEILRQSLLKMAFNGKLVSQNSDDEPAINLLKRIKDEKEKYEIDRRNNSKILTKMKTQKNKELTIIEVLETSDTPLPAKFVWEQSKFKNDIEKFYDELKKVQDKVSEVEKGFLSLINENR
ncbi:restriction endonuclease subunit S [Spirosoma arcticum]